jgi:chromate reductase
MESPLEVVMRSVAVLVGSLRKDSINRKFARSVGMLAKDRLSFRFTEIGDLPLYNDDLWQAPPEPVVRMKREVEAADGVLFVTPEYNRSYSPAIMNAVDWGSRPSGKNSWGCKPASIIGASPGAIGTAAAQNALKGLLVVCDMVLMGQPEVYMAYKPELFDAEGNVVNEGTKKFLNGWIDRFAGWIELTSEPRTTAQADAA